MCSLKDEESCKVDPKGGGERSHMYCLRFIFDDERATRITALEPDDGIPVRSVFDVDVLQDFW